MCLHLDRAARGLADIADRFVRINQIRASTNSSAYLELCHWVQANCAVRGWRRGDSSSSADMYRQAAELPVCSTGLHCCGECARGCCMSALNTSTIPPASLSPPHGSRYTQGHRMEGQLGDTLLLHIPRLLRTVVQQSKERLKVSLLFVFLHLSHVS